MMVNQIYESNPDANFVFATTGFSRGATTIRALHNLLVDSGVPNLSTEGRNIIEPGKINIGASVLFDTVSTGVGLLYDISIPSQVNNVLHLTARDEARTFFPLVSTLNSSRSNDGRILELTLPGAHTDIGGGSYDIGGLGHMNLQLSYTYLEKLGVPLAPFPSDFTPQPDRFVIHDSRWVKDEPFSQLLNQGVQRNVSYVRNR